MSIPKICFSPLRSPYESSVETMITSWSDPPFDPIFYFVIRTDWITWQSKEAGGSGGWIKTCHFNVSCPGVDIVMNNDLLWLLQSISTANTLRLAGVPLNKQNDLEAINIRFGRRRWSIEYSYDFSALGVLSPLSDKELFTSKQTPFNICRFQFVRPHVPIFFNLD